MLNILIVENKREISSILEEGLIKMPAQVHKATNGKAGLEIALMGLHDFIILDVKLPKMDGLEVCQKIRAANVTTPIIKIAAEADIIDKVLGLEMGANDVLPKAFNPRELLAKINSILRYTNAIKKDVLIQNKGMICKGDLSINLDRRITTLSDKKIDLSPIEFDILSLLINNQGKSFSKEQLLKEVWRDECIHSNNVVNSNINRLRTKIEENSSKPKYIITSRGVGYKFNEEVF